VGNSSPETVKRGPSATSQKYGLNKVVLFPSRRVERPDLALVRNELDRDCLRLGYIGYLPPFVSCPEEHGTPEGISVDFFSVMANDLEIKNVEFIQTSWSSLATDIASRHIDTVLDLAFPSITRPFSVVPLASVQCNVLVYAFAAKKKLTREIARIRDAIETVSNVEQRVHDIQEILYELRMTGAKGISTTRGIVEHDAFNLLNIHIDKIYDEGNIAENAADAIKQGYHAILDLPSAILAVTLLRAEEIHAEYKAVFSERKEDSVPAGYPVNPMMHVFQNYLRSSVLEYFFPRDSVGPLAHAGCENIGVLPILNRAPPPTTDFLFPPVGFLYPPMGLNSLLASRKPDDEPGGSINDADTLNDPDPNYTAPRPTSSDYAKRINRYTMLRTALLTGGYSVAAVSLVIAAFLYSVSFDSAADALLFGKMWSQILTGVGLEILIGCLLMGRIYRPRSAWEELDHEQ